MAMSQRGPRGTVTSPFLSFFLPCLLHEFLSASSGNRSSRGNIENIRELEVTGAEQRLKLE